MPAARPIAGDLLLNDLRGHDEHNVRQPDRAECIRSTTEDGEERRASVR